MSAVPILDFSRFTDGEAGAFVTELGAVCRDTGFFVLTNHGIGDRLVANSFEMARRFFSLPQTQKDALSISLSPHNRGYATIGSESLDENSGVADKKEAFNIGLDLAVDDPRVLANEPFRGVNVWPDMDGFRDASLVYFQAVWALGRKVHEALALSLDLPRSYFEAHFNAPMATLRMLRYPPASGAKNEIGAGAHTDYGSITLLKTDGVSGLQVKPCDRDWIDVPHIEGAFIVNIGDCLMRWTNDVYVSTPHRVLPPATERYSIAFFLDPNPDSVIEKLPTIAGPAKYKPVTGAQYLMQRLTATYK
ncbi:MAG: 2-oxoglutarate and iron-dependent oxygenase domain-containing protein [Pseudomonadota bacterium]